MTSAQRWEGVLDAVIREVAGFGVAPGDTFFDAGLTSVTLVAAHHELVSRFGADVPVTVFFKYPSRRALGAFLADMSSTADATGESASAGNDQAVHGARRWNAQDRRDLRSRLRQRKG